MTGREGAGLESVHLTSHPHYLQKGPLDLIETGQGLKVQTDKPHLVSLGSGRLSTAITLLPLEEGELRAGRTRLLPFHHCVRSCPGGCACGGPFSLHLVLAFPDCLPSLKDELIYRSV